MTEANGWIRKKEITKVLREIGSLRFKLGLEIGAGNGFQSKWLKKISNKLIVTEYNEERLIKRKMKGVQYKICDAQNLPFKENTFDFVFSSNVLEHIPDRDKCLKSIKKVSKDTALIVHTMPTRACKLSQMFFYYVKLLHILLSRKKRTAVLREKKLAKQQKKVSGSNLKKRGGRSIISCIFPPIHGEYKSHLEEYIMSGQKQWIRKLRRNGYSIIKIVRMPFFFSYGYNIEILQKLFNIIGLSSSYAYFMKVKK